MRGALISLFTLLACLAATVSIWSVVAPHQVEKAWGSVKMTVDRTVGNVVHAVTQPNAPNFDAIALGELGTERDLDACTGQFVELGEYRMEGVPPVFAAHNNCGGDIILGWQAGQTVLVDSVPYTVTDERRTSKTHGQVSELVGMNGTIVVQSCFYGEDTMLFLALTSKPVR